jgi:hypothetical protein
VVVRARRPASVIAVVALLVGLVFAGPPAATAQDPPAPIPPYRIGYVSQDGTGEDRDIWSANAAGQDRTDVTNRPRLDETHPAYSPDGTRLAYTEQGADGSLRVIVADADGLNPRPLTDPEPDLQGDPTWSPDGTMIAFTNVVDQDGFEVQSIRIVRVADGRPLGDIPMPAHLQGKDLQPAWSPDGSRIALARNAAQLTPRVGPFTPAVAAVPGGSFSVPAVLRTPIAPAHPEIVFLIDNSGSMGGVLNAVKTQLGEVLQAVLADRADAQFGLATYSDIIDGDNRFRLWQRPTADTAVLLEKLNAVGTVNGGDDGEDWYNGLYQLTAQSVFTAPTSRIVVLVGDAWSHTYCPPSVPRIGGVRSPALLGQPSLPEPCNSDPLYLTRANVENALTAPGREVKVVAIPVTSGEFTPGLDRYDQASYFAERTGGSILSETAEADKIADAIKRGISDLKVTVTPDANCEDGLELAFEPPSTTVTGGAEVSFSVTARVSGDAPVGAELHCTTEFHFDGPPAPAEPFVQHLTVSVTDSRLPRMTIEGQAVPADGPRAPASNTAPARVTRVETNSCRRVSRPPARSVRSARRP